MPRGGEAVSIKAPGRGGVERWQVELWEGLRGTRRTESDSGSGCSLGRGGRNQSEILEWRLGSSLAIGLERETDYLQASVSLPQMKVIKVKL